MNGPFFGRLYGYNTATWNSRKLIYIQNETKFCKESPVGYRKMKWRPSKICEYGYLNKIKLKGYNFF